MLLGSFRVVLGRIIALYVLLELTLMLQDSLFVLIALEALINPFLVGLTVRFALLACINPFLGSLIAHFALMAPIRQGLACLLALLLHPARQLLLVLP